MKKFKKYVYPILRKYLTNEQKASIVFTKYNELLVAYGKDLKIIYSPETPVERREFLEEWYKRYTGRLYNLYTKYELRRINCN